MYGQNNNGTHKRRSPYAIVAEIGKYASDGRGITINTIFDDLGFTYAEAEKYTNFLEKVSVLKKKIERVPTKNDEKDKIYFYATPKFADFLHVYTIIEYLCRKETLNNTLRKELQEELKNMQNGDGKKNLQTEPPVIPNGNGKKKNENIFGGKRRSHIDIYVDIIGALRRIKKKYELSREANLSTDQHKKYKKKMSSIRFLRKERNGSEVPAVTRKGDLFNGFYKVMNSLFIPGPQDEEEFLYNTESLIMSISSDVKPQVELTEDDLKIKDPKELPI